MKRWLYLFLCVSLTQFACDSQGDRVATLESGMWRGEITLPGGQLPFQFEMLDPNASGAKAYVINGDERVPINHLEFRDGKLFMEFPAFNTHIKGELKGREILGELTLTKRHGKLQHMPLRLQYGKNFRFFEQAEDAEANFSGRWRVEFTDSEGEVSPAVAEFEQQDGKVTGTFRTPVGDYRYLAGEVSNRTLFLSTFDGAHAFLFDAVMNEAGKLRGNFWSGTQWHESWTAVKDDEATLDDPTQMTKVVSGTQKFVVEFPDVQGRMVRSDAPEYQGKVVIVALAGTWCPNCHDEAAFLSPFYRAYREQGLEVIGLMYEHLDAFDEAAAQVYKFKDKFAIEYRLLVAGSSDKSKASETLPMLNQVIAFPTMIVMDRKGEVRMVHTGFNGPGTGEKYDEFRREFTEFIEQLLNEEHS